MDEPTASLDPDIADKTLSLIEELRRERNLSILYTSHNMTEIARICDEVIFLDRGTIVAKDTPDNLTKSMGSATLILTFSGSRDAIERHLKQDRVAHTFVTRQCVEIPSAEKVIPEILFNLSHLGNAIVDIEVRKPTLEDVFLHIARQEV